MAAVSRMPEAAVGPADERSMQMKVEYPANLSLITSPCVGPADFAAHARAGTA
jgi:hypothetical protein